MLHWDVPKAYYSIKHHHHQFMNVYSASVASDWQRCILLALTWITFFKIQCLPRTLKWSATSSTLVPGIQLTTAAGTPNGLVNFTCHRAGYCIIRVLLRGFSGGVSLRRCILQGMWSREECICGWAVLTGFMTLLHYHLFSHLWGP